MKLSWAMKIDFMDKSRATLISSAMKINFMDKSRATLIGI